MFKLSSEAKAVVSSYLSSKELAGSLPMVTWENARDDKITGRWIVGFIKRERLRGVEEGFLHEIDGIEFVIDGPQRHLSKLQGATLDVENDKLVFMLAE